MAVKVYDFYAKDRVSTNKYHNILMNSTTFYILLNTPKGFKELSITIPKRYHYETTYFNYTDFAANKVSEYNVLNDFLKNNEELLKEKWGLSKEELLEVREELKLALVRMYSTCGFPRNVLLEASVLFKVFVNRVLRRFLP